MRAAVYTLQPHWCKCRNQLIACGSALGTSTWIIIKPTCRTRHLWLLQAAARKPGINFHVSKLLEKGSRQTASGNRNVSGMVVAIECIVLRHWLRSAGNESLQVLHSSARLSSLVYKVKRASPCVSSGLLMLPFRKQQISLCKHSKAGCLKTISTHKLTA